MTLDYVIRNGTVIDGSGNPGYRADVGISGDRIVEIGDGLESTSRDIDATGCVVTPGFIDGHTHMDAQVMWDPFGRSSVWHGVTSAIMGNCGFTLAPSRHDARDLVIRNIQRAEDISAAALAIGVDWTWETFSEYLDALDRQPLGINYATNIGHSALRTWAMGERAFEESANEDDLLSMERELRRALDAGALGFTTTRSRAHETPDDKPVASRLATWSEVCRLVGVLGEFDDKVFQVTPGPGGSEDAPSRQEAYRWISELAISSGVTTTYGLLAITPIWSDTLELIEQTTARGGNVFVQSHPRGVSVVLSFKTRLPFDRLPVWRELRSKPLDEQRAALRDPEVRRRLVDAASAAEYGRAIGAEARPPDYEKMRVLFNPIPPNPSVADVARERGCDPVEAIIDLALESDLERFFFQPLNPETEDDLVSIMRHPNSVMTFSDSGAHVSQIMDSSIQTYLLSYWVRQRARFSLEEAIQMMTSGPARVWNLTGRGLLAPGNFADINIFDPEVVSPMMPTVENDLPGGGPRLEQRSTGFLATIVGGTIVVDQGEITEATPGRIIRGKGRAASGE
jgi:N-acyl-D-aspartate/D-glutamate deacylase